MGRRRQRVDLAAGARARALPEAIAALSRSLPSGPSPEIFRRAKFDRPEATSALWQLLYRVLSPLPAGNALASLALEVQARLVKSALCSQGYPRLALAQLPEDGSQGSRELLLALSWLLARGPVPEHMLAQARVPLGDEMTVCQCEALASPGPPAPHMEAEGPVDVRHVQWLMGKLRFRWRQLVSSQQEQCTLLSKIHLYTRGCHSDQSLGHLSVTEAEMLRDPEGGQQVSRAGAAQNLDLAYPKCLHSSCTPGMGPRTFWNDLWLVCERPGLLPGDWAAPLDPGGASAYSLLSPLRALLRTLEHENQRLEAVLAWRRTELVFWRWMDTVLGTCSLEVPAAASQPTFLPWVPERGGGELELVMRELQALEEELQEAVERRRAAWEAKAGGCGRGPEWSAARRASREAVERELGALQRCWEQDSGPAQPHGPHRLVRREDGAAGDRDLRAAEVIRTLRSQEACLEAVLRRLQGQCQQELARLVGALPGFIWIPSPGR
ncbi:tubulin epsilon and delta complex protein 1 isoform X1 [Hylobates moloch]|uniref:tubulin epsilon and delta complex protein 1 isoform X1 n=2 Tax=Hylobates moloch TaxID=81572 RepID=UPI00136483CB|nr:tubulin epsilon and delta complex protein 1 isoform X1 [Hylobates moloch]